MDTFFSDTDLESFSESGSEDLEDIESVYGGQAQSILSSLEESIGKIDDFLSFERGFTHGDIVCSVTDPSGQMGRVENVNMFVDLENVFGRVTRDINSKKLLKIRSISVGDYVVFGPWIGRVDKVVDRFSILFDDGAKCEIMTMDQEKILPISPNLLEDSQYPYYPGQRVQVRLSTLSTARWLCGTQKEIHDEGTVCAVEAGLVYVDWLASALLGSDLVVPTPPRLQDSRNLTLLSCYSHANWQLGDWCILPIGELKGGMEQIMYHTSTFELGEGCKKLEKGFKGRGINSKFEEIFVIVKTKTKVDVLWQDGKCSLGLDSQSLLPINIVDAHEFWPGQFVFEKGTCDDPDASSGQKWGVVKGVDAKEKTVKIKWEYISENQGNHLEGDQMEEMVSAYELVEHPSYSYCFGEVVFRAVPNQFVHQGDEKTYKDPVNPELDTVVMASLCGTNCGRSQNEYSDKDYLSHIGHVTGFKDGGVEVRWATGLITKVAPCEIISIEKYEGSNTTPMLHEENIEESNGKILSWESNASYDGVGEDRKRHPWESSAFFLPRAAIGFVTSIAGSLFGSLGFTSLSGSMSSIHEFGNPHEEQESESCTLCTERQPMILGDLQTSIKTFSKLQDEETGKNENISVLSGSKNPEQFGQFDMVDDCLDHHFVDDAGSALAISQVKREWLKKVQQEWSILEKDLPGSIYVRIYEERMDLLRAAIVGAPGTPYHDGLFFFDIFLPREYPREPPLVHYHSGGLRLNPNLYESGKVCLSLLNTWTGSGTEVWNSGSSTILQVLLSLQALVLNEKPYFNEAGYDTQMGRAEGEKNSVSYNENAFIVTCKSMLYILRKPPKHFEALVEEHFNRRAHYILKACKAYMEGAPVGCSFRYEKTEQENQKGGSMGFKIMLTKLFPKLLEAFSDKGIDCSQFIDPAM